MKILLLFTLISCTNLFYQPSDRQFYRPEAFKLTYQDIYFQSSDGTKLHGWFFKGKGKPKGTIVQFHGNAENISSHFLNLAWLVLEGYNLFTFDYRGCNLRSRATPEQESGSRYFQHFHGTEQSSPWIRHGPSETSRGVWCRHHF